MRFRTILSAALSILLMACGGGGGAGVQETVAATPPPAPVTGAAADISMLFMGNSHTSINNVPSLVAAMVRAGKPGKAVSATEAAIWIYLEERANDANSRALLQSQRWTYIVLQAQNYSLSGQVFYPTADEERLVCLSRQTGALPILLAEWPLAGIAETQIILDKYVSIATKEPACVSPNPQAFHLSRARFPAITLHDADDIHSVHAGTLLASPIFYATMTGASPLELPIIGGINEDADAQAKLRGVVNETVQTSAPRLWCPNDRPAG